MMVACIELEGLGLIQASSLTILGQHDGPGGVHASGRQTATWPPNEGQPPSLNRKSCMR
jgi:hypothetical protein